MEAAGELISALEQILRSIFPALGRTQCQVRARVTDLHEAGGQMTDLEPRYSVDVQVLAPDGSVDPDWPEIPDVPLPVIWAGQERGMFCLPQVGSIVRLGFEYGDRNRPYVDSVTGEGWGCLEHPAGSFLVISHDHWIELTRDGNIVLRGGDVTIDGGSITIRGGSVHLDGGDVRLAAGMMPVMVMGPLGPQPAVNVRAS